MPIEVISSGGNNNMGSKSFGIFNKSDLYTGTGSGFQPVSGLTNGTLMGIRLQGDETNGDRIIVDEPGTYQISLSILVSLSDTAPVGVFDLRGFVRKNTDSGDYARNQYTYDYDGSHPIQSRCAVDHIDMVANDYVRIFYFDSSSLYEAIFQTMRLCITKIS